MEGLYVKWMFLLAALVALPRTALAAECFEEVKIPGQFEERKITVITEAHTRLEAIQENFDYEPVELVVTDAHCPGETLKKTHAWPVIYACMCSIQIVPASFEIEAENEDVRRLTVRQPATSRDVCIPCHSTSRRGIPVRRRMTQKPLNCEANMIIAAEVKTLTREFISKPRDVRSFKIPEKTEISVERVEIAPSRIEKHVVPCEAEQ